MYKGVQDLNSKLSPKKEIEDCTYIYIYIQHFDAFCIIFVQGQLKNQDVFLIHTYLAL